MSANPNNGFGAFATGGSPFQLARTDTAAQSGSSLGTGSAGSGTTPSLFGATQSGQPPALTSQTTGNSLFGNNNTGSSGGGLFGDAGNMAPAGVGNMFGGNGAAFGTTTSTTTAPNTFFGGTSSGTTGLTSAFGGAASSGLGLFGAPKHADQNVSPAATTGTPTAGLNFGGAAASQSAGSNFFSQPSTSAPPTAGVPGTEAARATPTAPMANTFGNFGTSTSTASTQSGGSLFGGSLYGKRPEVSTTPPGPTSATTMSAPATSSFTGFSLGGNKDTPASKDGISTAPTASLFGSVPATKENSFQKKDALPVTPAPLSLFGAIKDPLGDKIDAPAAPTSLFSLGGSSTATKEAEKPKETSKETIGPTTTTSTTISVAPPSMLRGKTIEDVVNRWSADLEVHVREFNNFAGEVAVWDRALIENGNNLAALFSHVLNAEREQNDIDQSLSHIEQQQKELASTLDVYEKSAEDILGGQGGSMRALDTGPADTERDKNYVLATELHTHLDDLAGSLAQMIDSVNTLSLPTTLPESANGTSSGTPGGEDPMGQIAQILSSHLESLQWIDGAVRELELKVTGIDKRIKDVPGVEITPSFSIGPKLTGFR